MRKIAIIGAGPAGIYAGLLLKDFQGKITLFEQNPDIGKKLSLTGGGRMNVTNKVFYAKQFESCEKNLLKKIFKNPHIKDREKILEKLGIEYVWENNRAILKSQNAVLEVQRLKKELQIQENMEVLHMAKVSEIKTFGSGEKQKFELEININGYTEKENFDVVILSQGGMYRIGDLKSKEKIYHLPLSLDHNITEVAPSLSALIFKNKKLSKLSGIAFKAELKDVKEKVSVVDDLLITHFGVSGPASLDFSALRKSEIVELNFLPDISEKEFLSQFNTLRQGKNGLKKFLKNFLPKRLIQFHLENSDIQISENNPDVNNQDFEIKFIADISKEKLKKLIQSLFHFEITDIQENIYPATWTTKGGVSLKEVHSFSLESKICKNLFFAGEILDINGLCGGYNISFAAISAQIVADEILSDKA